MIYIGIDPGLTGGLVARMNGAVIAQVHDIAKRKPEVLRLLQGLCQGPHAVALEDLPNGTDRPRGRNSATTMGSNHGWLVGVLDAIGADYKVYAPVFWQERMLGAKSARKILDTKEASVALAEKDCTVNLLPSSRMKNKHDGLADAFCLSLFAEHPGA